MYANPTSGSQTSDPYLVNNANLKKCLYYGYGGPGDLLTSRYGASGAIVLTDELVSNAYSNNCISYANNKGYHWRTTVSGLWNEIVSKPDMHSAKEAAAYVETLRKNLLYLNVSDVKMEEGSMRCDVNISLSKDKDTLGTKTEIKNLNSIANVQKAVQAEIERQSALLDAGEKVEQATRRYDEAQKTTILMRKKEGNVDYKYFPEPNIFPIQLDLDWVKSIQDNLEELPDARLARFMKDYELSEYDASVLVADCEMADFFEEVLKSSKFAKKACNWIIGDVSAYLNKNNLSFAKVPCSSENLASLINVIEAGEISGKQGKVVFEQVMQGKDPKKVIEEKGMKQVSDDGAILAIVNSVLDANPQSIEDFKNGKDRAVGFLVGQVMKASRGQANPKRTNELIQEELKKR